MLNAYQKIGKNIEDKYSIGYIHQKWQEDSVVSPNRLRNS
jgi:hypothetical protein